MYLLTIISHLIWREYQKEKVEMDVGIVLRKEKSDSQVILLELDEVLGRHPTPDANPFFWVPTFIHAFPAAQASLPYHYIGQNLMYFSRSRSDDTSEKLFPSLSVLILNTC